MIKRTEQNNVRKSIIFKRTQSKLLIIEQILCSLYFDQILVLNNFIYLVFNVILANNNFVLVMNGQKIFICIVVRAHLIFTEIDFHPHFEIFDGQI